MPKKNQKNKTKQTFEKTTNVKKRASVAEVWSEEDSVTASESMAVALPPSTAPVPLVTPERHSLLTKPLRMRSHSLGKRSMWRPEPTTKRWEKRFP